MCTVT